MNTKAFSLEEKIILAQEAQNDPDQELILDIVQGAMATLPAGLEDHIDVLYDIIYNAVQEAIERSDQW